MQYTPFNNLRILPVSCCASSTERSKCQPDRMKRCLLELCGEPWNVEYGQFPLWITRIGGFGETNVCVGVIIVESEKQSEKSSDCSLGITLYASF